MVKSIRLLVRLAFAFLLMSLLSVQGWCESLIQVRIHEEKLFQSESFLLIVTAQGRYTNDELDTRPLTEQNFIIGSIGFNYDIDKNESYWRIPVLTHETGNKQIPSMLLQSNVTIPIPVVIRKKSNVSNYPELRNLMSYSISSSQEAYTSQTLIYTVTINHNENVEISTISSPRVKGGNVHLINERNTQNRNKSTTVKTYAVSFSDPGNFEIEQPVITGRYNTIASNMPHSANNPIISNEEMIVLKDPSKKQNSKGLGKQKTRLRFVQQNENIKLNIKGFENLKNVIVADDFKIKESWYPNTNKITANTPITHELEFEATGASIENFPKIHIEGTPQIKVYEDKGYSNESYDPETGTIHSKQTIRYIYIPLKKMRVHFDPISINWIKTDSQKTDLNVYNLKKIDYEVEPQNKEEYNLENNFQNKILYIVLIILSILLIMCFVYLLYLQGIIKFNFITRYITNFRMRKYVLKNFSDTDARNNYELIMSYAHTCLDPRITGFQMMPQYQEYQQYLDQISYFVWKRKISEQEKYNGKEFRNKLKSFLKYKNHCYKKQQGLI